ncbi:MAG TPA: sigma-70 family RNA polymerase sigma factor [Acidobacteriaceae bacterium]|jgi:RNA polymerase sigma-70 factor (ECF subfamily)|nr:sigma-70 family RNA polymerase sigma factor [Acidobacteriaceae bacterium]
MNEHEWLAERFEENRRHLQGVAYRLLGSLSEAEDAVQEGWLRLSRSGAEGVENLPGWLTTVVARVCLDMLRSRKSRGEESLETPGSEAAAGAHRAIDPEQETMLAESVGLATLVVLDRLNPAERIAFVLHDVFDVPFEEIARIAGRTSESVRQLASRARRRVRGVTSVPEGQIAQQRSLVEGFLAALRAGDAEKLVTLMTPEFAARADAAAAPRGLPEVYGAEGWAREAIRTANGARLARVALVDGAVGLVVAPRGRLFRVLRFTFADGRIAGLEVIGDREQLRRTEVAVPCD